MNYSNSMSTGNALLIARFSLLLLLVTTTLRAADPYTKTIDKSFAAVPEVAFAQANGHLEVLPATDGKIRFVARISINATDEAQAQQFLDRMDLLATESSASLELRLNLNNVTSWRTTGNRSLIKFADGEKIRGVSNFDVRSTLYLPPTQLLELSVRFSDVNMDHQVVLNNLTLALANAEVRGGVVKGDLRVDARFGSVLLESATGQITGTLTNNRLELTRGGGNLHLNTRFSELELGSMRSVDLTSANDQVEIAAVTGPLKLNERFGQYRLGTTEDADIISTNGDYTVATGGTYTINGRFTTVEFGQVTALTLTANANSTYRADRLSDLRGDGRFTNISVDQFTGRADLDLSNGEFRVDQLSPSFTGIRVDGRFFEVDVSLAGAAVYQAKAKLTFGRLDVPEGLTARVDKESGNELEKLFLSEGATEDSAMIEVTGSNAALRIR